jgi:DeoR family suf operon transcriptional repressor
MTSSPSLKTSTRASTPNGLASTAEGSGTAVRSSTARADAAVRADTGIVGAAIEKPLAAPANLPGSPTLSRRESASPKERDASTREAALTVLLRRGKATAAELADHLQVSVQAMRRHLRGLEEDGLVEASCSGEGPGRPSNRWQLTTKGQGQFPDGSEDFALGLLESIAGNLPAGTVQKLLAQQAREKAEAYRRHLGNGPLRQRLEHLVELRRREGYVAECCADDDGWVISEFHCSVMRIAEQFPCVCDQELQLLRQTFPDCQVERVHWRLEKGHSCGFRLSPRTPA